MAIEVNAELRAKLLKAKGAEEMASVLEEAGQQATEKEIERLAAEVQYASEHDGEQLSLNELDAVSGGSSRNYTKDGCVATVEYNSDCWGEDGGCIAVHYSYAGKPVNVRCPKCGDRYMFKSHYIQYGDQEKIGVLACPYCKTERQVELSLWDALIPG